MSNEGKVDAPAVPQDMRLVPVWLLERVERSLGAFTSDEGWAQTDMDTMDSVSAMIAATPATAPAQEVGLTDEEIEAIAKKHMSTVGDHWCNEDAIRERHAEDFARAIIAALRAKGGT